MDKSFSVLIVDDNAYMRTIITTIVRAFGTTVIDEAANGADALERLRTRKFDCAIVDLAMDPINGLEFLHLVRTSKDSPDRYLPVIIVSAHSSRAQILQARDAGADEILTKPVTASALLARLKAVIEERRPFVSSGAYFGPDRRRKRVIDYAGPFRRHDDPDIFGKG